MKRITSMIGIILVMGVGMFLIPSAVDKIDHQRKEIERLRSDVAENRLNCEFIYKQLQIAQYEIDSLNRELGKVSINPHIYDIFRSLQRSGIVGPGSYEEKQSKDVVYRSLDDPLD